MPENAICQLCDQLAQIVGGKGECQGEACSVAISRQNIQATIRGRPVRTEGVLSIELSFEGLDEHGQALCLGEAVLLQGEVNRFLSVLRRHQVEITAIHNHWLFDQPTLIYLHFLAITTPVRFARTVAEAVRGLQVPPQPPH